MKKIITAIITCFLLTPFIAQSVYANAFPDVSGESEYFTAIEYFYEKDIIQGYEDGTFRPNQEANRAEALKIILLGSSVSIDDVTLGLNIFPDVAADDWHYIYIKKAKELKIVEGYEDGTFKPEKVQNLAETLKMILLTNNVSLNPLDPNDPWFTPYTFYALEKHIIEPENDGTINAGKGITRGELIELMYRMEIVLQNNGEPFDISTNWKTVKFPQYAFETKLPFTWKIVNNEDEVVFWRPDEINHQSSYEVPFPFSASTTFHLDTNEEGITPAVYEAQLEMVYKSDFGSYQKNSLTLAGYPAVEFNASPVHDDYFIFYPNNQVLHVYTSYGWSDLTGQLKLEIEGILENISYVTPDGSTSNPSGDILSDVRNKILVEGMGQETLNLFTDLINIETDTIGVGTGPVDYFYSAIYDVTIKYERSSDTILDMQEGQTSAF